MQRSLMTLTSAAVLGSLTAVAVVVSACGSSDPQPATAASATAYPPGYYPPQPQPYPQQPQPYPQQPQPYPQQPQPYPQQPQPYPQQPPAQPYPSQQPTPYPSAPPTPAPTASGTMAVPGPLAMACQADSACGLHRCNVPYSKCAFPCAGAVDCTQGNQCTMGICTPSLGGH